MKLGTKTHVYVSIAKTLDQRYLPFPQENTWAGFDFLTRAIARLFVENGAFVVIADVQDELGHQVVESIGVEKASYRHCDVRDEKQVEEIVAYTLDKYGGLDIMFSNACVIGAIHGILELDMEAFDNTMAINVRGVAVTMKYAARAMVAKQIQ
ncbi:hypothetical protein IFM89_035853 [Coptis chinensis]|uniref:Uncharacterized protein n=1 Tax=Coptis chinensis TaxID=261450 RepID=A0A835HS26_9MAGN|nr:hypothetical protein IFM89_035853 [Coptis chinensis]